MNILNDKKSLIDLKTPENVQLDLQLDVYKKQSI